MIVRISGEGQYRLPDGDEGRLNELEAEVQSALDGGRETDFPGSYGALLDYVRSAGERLAEDELEPSQVILPPADISFQEASREFTGEGLIPD
jgi:hypothetical protein